MIKKYKLLLISCLILLCLLFKCTSIPEPSDNASAILVLPMKLSGDLTAATFGNIRIEIRNQETNKVVTSVYENPKNGFAIIEVPEPGKYIIGARYMRKNKIHTPEKFTFDIIVIIEGYVTISTTGLDMRIEKIGQLRSVLMQPYWYNISEIERNEIFEELKTYDNFDLWKIAE